MRRCVETNTYPGYEREQERYTLIKKRTDRIKTCSGIKQARKREGPGEQVQKKMTFTMQCIHIKFPTGTRKIYQSIVRHII